jgi:hypothetical protein
MMPNDLPPWHTVYQQTQRWLAAGVFEAMVHDLRRLLRVVEAKQQSQVPPFWMDARSSPVSRVAAAPVGMDTNANGAARCIWP